MTSLTIEPLDIPGAPLGDENPLPYFRDSQVDRPVDARGLPAVAGLKAKVWPPMS